MDVGNAILKIFNLLSSIIGVLDSTAFKMFGYDVSLWSLILVFIVVYIFANVWWKGARG